MTRLTTREALSTWPGSWLIVEDKMIDLSKLDWKKCELPDYEGAGLTVDYVPKIIEQVRIKNRSIIVATRTTTDAKHPWRIHDAHCSVFAFIEHILKCAKLVDAFIASETARLAAEEEAENWLTVPWQDAEWLTENGASVQVLDDEIREWVRFQRNAKATHRRSYRTHYRTFPAGYDPDKPRWVAVGNDQVQRLSDYGCAFAICGGIHGNQWKEVYNPNGSKDYSYAIDIHTLPPGVSIHEEPKLVPRPCTKEFALARKVDGGDWKLEGETVELGIMECKNGYEVFTERYIHERDMPNGKWKITATMVD